MPIWRSFPKRILVVTRPLSDTFSLINVEKKATDQHCDVLEGELARTFGRNVMRLRKRAGLTKKRFCLMVGVGRPYFNRVENGTADPRLSIVERFAAALDVAPLDLLTDSSTPAAKKQRGASSPKGHERL